VRAPLGSISQLDSISLRRKGNTGIVSPAFDLSPARPASLVTIEKGILTRMSTPAASLSFSEVLRLRPARRLWIAQIVSVFGDFLAVFAIIAVVTFQLHGTAAFSNRRMLLKSVSVSNTR